MTDTTQGADAPDDAALFSEATSDSTTLEQFENPKIEEKPPAPADGKTTEKVVPDKVEQTSQKEEPQIPQARLREESEARRRAERERDELVAWKAAQLARQQQTTEQPKQPDFLSEPGEFVRSIVQPLLEAQSQREQQRLEAISMDNAVQRHGPEVVVQSRQALEYFMQRNDPGAWETHKRAMASHDPYGVITNWYHERSLLHEIGGDPKAYVDRQIAERLKDPEYKKQYLEMLKSEAAASGNVANRPPVTVSIPKMPSLGNIGAAGGDTQQVEPSDMDLFRAATTAKRR
jgi:hypothetical protein